MRARSRLNVAVLVVALGGCQSAPGQLLVVSPSGTVQTAARHNDEGIQAYNQKQYESAKQHFEAAVQASPELAEAHYNLGMTLYELGAVREGNTHSIKAANLAPGNKVIWNSPPLKSVYVPEKEVKSPASDGHLHSQ